MNAKEVRELTDKRKEELLNSSSACIEIIDGLIKKNAELAFYDVRVDRYSDEGLRRMFLREELLNEVVGHYKREGFKVAKDYSLVSGEYLEISWDDKGGE